MAVEQPFGCHVAHENPSNTQSELEVCRHFGDRLRHRAQSDDALALECESRLLHEPTGRRTDDRLDRKLFRRTRASTGQRVGPDTKASVSVIVASVAHGSIR